MLEFRGSPDYFLIREVNERLCRYQGSATHVNSGGLPPCKPLPPLLEHDDYEVRFWTKAEYDAYQESKAGVTDGNATHSKRRGRPAKGDENTPTHPYLEDENGTPVPTSVVRMLSQKARSCWHLFADEGCAPEQWGQGNTLMREWYIAEILSDSNFKFLRYCEGGMWKLAEWTMLNYPSWANNHVSNKDDDGSDSALEPKPTKKTKSKRKKGKDRKMTTSTVKIDLDGDNLYKMSDLETSEGSPTGGTSGAVSFNCNLIVARAKCRYSLKRIKTAQLQSQTLCGKPYALGIVSFLTG
jgi:hypothetical protein